MTCRQQVVAWTSTCAGILIMGARCAIATIRGTWHGQQVPTRRALSREALVAHATAVTNNLELGRLHVRTHVYRIQVFGNGDRADGVQRAVLDSVLSERGAHVGCDWGPSC
jgi:hypothetical protein